jgi:hypothetical protein
MGFLDTPVPQQTAASLAGKVSKGDLMVNAADYITANGTTDDGAALLTAMGLGSVILMPRNKVIAIGSKLVIPSDKTIIMNGSSFKGLTESGDFMVTVASNTHIIGRLDVTTAAGTNLRGVQISGSNIRIDSISSKTPAPGGGVGDQRDNGLAIAAGSSSVTIGRVLIQNFDYGCRIESTTNVSIANFEVISYVQGVYLSENKSLSIDKGYIHVASPNAAVAPGNNGVLIDALTHGGTQGVRLTGVVVEDSGEHAFRIGGSFRVSEVWHTNCVARNAGASGFKALGGTTVDNNYHDGLHYTDCIAEDVGQTDNNAVGFLIQYVRDSTLNAPIVRKRNKANSGYSGIRLNNCINVTTTNPTISDTINACYRVDPELGNNTNIRLVGGLLSSATGNGIVIDYSGITNRRVSVTGNPQVEISGTGYCVSVVNTSGGTVTGGADMEFTTTTAAANIMDTTTTGFNYATYMCNISGAFPTTAPTFLNGSKWTERSGSYRVKANAGWYVVDLVCTTATRPTNCAQGQQALDTTLGKPIWLKTTPSAWIDATGATV